MHHAGATGVLAVQQRRRLSACTLGHLRPRAPLLGGSNEVRSLESGSGARFSCAPGLEKKNPHQLYGGAHVLQAWTWALRAYEGVHATSCWLRDVRAGQLDRQCRVMLLKECSEKLVASDNSDSDGSTNTDDSDHKKKPTASRVLLREDAKYYVRNAATVDGLLDVRK